MTKVFEKTDFTRYDEIFNEVIRIITVCDTMIQEPKTNVEISIWNDLMDKKKTDIRLDELHLATELQECLGKLYEMIGSHTTFGKMNNEKIEKFWRLIDHTVFPFLQRLEIVIEYKEFVNSNILHSDLLHGGNIVKTKIADNVESKIEIVKNTLKHTCKKSWTPVVGGVNASLPNSSGDRSHRKVSTLKPL